MAPTNQELELEARIVALEYLVKQCFWQIILNSAIQETEGEDEDDADGLTIRGAKTFRKKVVNELEKATFSGRDPAVSDHLAALVREHAGRVVGELVQDMEKKLSPRPS
jgi:hypothetical protein